MIHFVDPLNQTVELTRSVLHGHIYRRHPELKRKEKLIEQTITDPDFIAKSKKDNHSLLYFRAMKRSMYLMVVASPIAGKPNHLTIRTSFYTLNTSKGDPIIWQKKIST